MIFLVSISDTEVGRTPDGALHGIGHVLFRGACRGKSLMADEDAFLPSAAEIIRAWCVAGDYRSAEISAIDAQLVAAAEMN